MCIYIKGLLAKATQCLPGNRYVKTFGLEKNNTVRA